MEKSLIMEKIKEQSRGNIFFFFQIQITYNWKEISTKKKMSQKNPTKHGIS
jgi:hypothetical protein